jgi:hypothetical protein
MEEWDYKCRAGRMDRGRGYVDRWEKAAGRMGEKMDGRTR